MEEKVIPVKCGCGGNAYVYRCAVEIRKPWSIMCERCGIVTDQYESYEKAVKAWNQAMRGGNGEEVCL